MHFTRIFPFGSGRSPPAPATSLLELDSGRHHHHLPLLLLGSQSLLHLLLGRGSQLHTQLPALLQCVCEEPRHLITRRVRGKESGSRFAICLPGTCLSHPAALPPSFHAHRSHTHATHNHNKHTAIWKEVLAFTPLEQKITIIYLIHFSCLLYDHWAKMGQSVHTLSDSWW